MAVTKLPFNKVLPINKIDQDLMINNQGDLTFGFEIKHPEVYKSTVADHDVYQTELIKMIDQTPHGTIFHSQDFYFIDEYEISNFSNPSKTKSKKTDEHYFNHRNIMQHRCIFYFTFPSEFSMKKGGISSAFDFLGNKSPIKKLDKRTNEVNRHAASLFNSLRSIKDLEVKRLDTMDLYYNLYAYMSFDYKKIKDTEELINPNIHFENDLFKIGNQYISIIDMVQEGKDLIAFANRNTSPSDVIDNGVKYSNKIDFPTSTSFPIGLGLPIDHVVNTIIQKINYSDTKTGVFGKRVMEIMSSSGELRESEFNDTAGNEVKNKHEQQQGFSTSVNKQGYTPVLFSQNVMVNHTDRERVIKYSEMVVEGFRNMYQAIGLVENFETYYMYQANCPGNQNLNHRLSKLHILDGAASYIPKETIRKSDPNGINLIDRYGSPICYNFMNNKLVNNKNFVLFGPSRTGKSFVINHLVSEFLSMSHFVFILDIGGSYEFNCQLNKGHYINTALKKNLAFNPFSCKKNKEGNYVYLVDDEDELVGHFQINYVYRVINTLFHNQDHETLKTEMTVIKRLITAFYDHCNNTNEFANIPNFHKYISVFSKESATTVDHKNLNFDDLELVLSNYVGKGEFAFLFDVWEDEPLEINRFTVYDLASINKDGAEEIRDLYILNVMQKMTRMVEELPTGYVATVVLDEAVDCMKGKLGDVIGGFFRKIAKANGHIGIGTQGVKYMNAVDPLVRDSVLGNCDYKILTDHRKYKDQYNDLQEMLSLRDVAFEMMDSMETGEGYRPFELIAGEFPEIFRMEVSPFNRELYNSEKKDKDIMRGYIEQFNSVELGIQKFVDEKYEATY